MTLFASLLITFWQLAGALVFIYVFYYFFVRYFQKELEKGISDI